MDIITDARAAWTNVMDAFLAARGHLRPDTLRLDCACIHWTIGTLERLGLLVPPEGLTRHVIEALIDVQLRDGLSPATIRIRLNILRQLGRYLVASGILTADPTDGLRMRSKYVPVKPIDAQGLAAYCRVMWDATATQTDTTHAAIRTASVAALAIDSGWWLREAIGCPLDAVDRERRLIHLPAEAARGGRPRTLPYGALGAAFLDRWLSARTTRVVSRPDLLYVSPRGGQMDYDSACAIMARWGVVAQLSAKVRPRVLRHSFALAYLAAGGDLESLRRILGYREWRYGSLRTPVEPPRALSALVPFLAPDRAQGRGPLLSAARPSPADPVTAHTRRRSDGQQTT